MNELLEYEEHNAWTRLTLCPICNYEMSPVLTLNGFIACKNNLCHFIEAIQVA